MAESPARRPTPLVLALVVAAGIVVLQALLVPLFSAPAAHLAPRDLPIVVAGPAPAVQGLSDRLTAAQPGAFEIITEPDAAAADRALRNHEAYAAFVVAPDGLALHTATAASPTVAGLLNQAVGQLAAGQHATVTEVVPAGPADPRGTGFAAGFLPLALTSMIVGVLLALVVTTGGCRSLGVVAYGVSAGFGAAAVLRTWLGVLAGDYLRDAAAIGCSASPPRRPWPASARCSAGPGQAWARCWSS